MPDQLRGPQHDFLWFDELAKFRYAQDVFDQAMFGLRLGTSPRWLATTTPRNIALIRALIVREGAGGVVVTRGTSDENLNNLSPSYRRNVIDRYRDSRLGRQELYAELLEDVPGALWSRRVLEECRVACAPDLARVIVAVDPPATSGEHANECGIVVVGVDEGGKAFVLDDWSAQGSPDEWARKVVAAYRLHEADCIVAEVNQWARWTTFVALAVFLACSVLSFRIVYSVEPPDAAPPTAYTYTVEFVWLLSMGILYCSFVAWCVTVFLKRTGTPERKGEQP